MRHPNGVWTNEQVAELRRLTGDGLSAGQIAKAMAKLRPGITRNAVVGARHRLGIETLAAPGTHSTVKKRRRALSRSLWRRRPSLKRKSGAAMRPLLPESPAPMPPPLASTWAPLPGTPPRPLLEHKAGQCHWPVTGAAGETLFCCAKQRSHSPYCVAHTRIAWAPRTKTRSRAA